MSDPAGHLTDRVEPLRSRKCFLRCLGWTQVVQDSHEDGFTQCGAGADGEMHGEHGAILAPAFDFPPNVDDFVLARPHVVGDEVVVLARENIRQQHIDALRYDLVFVIAEHVKGGFVRFRDAAFTIRYDNRVDRRIEHGCEQRGIVSAFWHVLSSPRRDGRHPLSGRSRSYCMISFRSIGMMVSPTGTFNLRKGCFDPIMRFRHRLR